MSDNPELAKKSEGADKPKTVTIPAGRTDDGKEQKHRTAPADERTLSEHLASPATPTPAPVYKTVDFGKAGSLKIEGTGHTHQGVSGAEVDVIVRISSTETHYLRAVPARLLKE